MLRLCALSSSRSVTELSPASPHPSPVRSIHHLRFFPRIRAPAPPLRDPRAARFTQVRSLALLVVVRVYRRWSCSLSLSCVLCTRTRHSRCIHHPRLCLRIRASAPPLRDPRAARITQVRSLALLVVRNKYRRWSCSRALSLLYRL